MKDSLHSFSELLEHYVFSVADKFIELADQGNQTRFIHLINKINLSITPNSSVTSLNKKSTGSLPDIKQELPAEIFTKSLEKQWQAALRKTAPKNREKYDQRTTTIERLIAIHQTNIEYTVSHIQRVDKLLERAEKNIADTHRNILITNHYQSIKNRYVTYISKLQMLKEQELLKLEQYR